MAVEIFERLPTLQHLIDLLRDTFEAEVQPSEDVSRVSKTIFSALERKIGVVGNPEPRRLEACSYIESALDTMRLGPPSLNRIAGALLAIEPKLKWYRPTILNRPTDDGYDSIVNAILIGPNGLEQRDDVMIGLTIMGPQTLYPNHQHLPEEIYRVLSEGEWRQNDGPWHEPGLGGTVYNLSNIVHAFRSKSRPLCAIWCLWRADQY
ncbi:MAG: dimethylsulfonioproprionate lyase family protein [Halopseudomonas aestusnigri]